MSKRDAKGVASKSDAKMVLTKLQYVTSWDETVLIKQHFRCYLIITRLIFQFKSVSFIFLRIKSFELFELFMLVMSNMNLHDLQTTFRRPLDAFGTLEVLN